MAPKADHYDGSDPKTPLPEEHFTEEQLRRSSQLGDGSPALEDPGEGSSSSDRSKGAPEEPHRTRPNL